MKVRRLIVLLSIFLVVTSCKEKDNSLIPPGKFKQILIDIHLADGLYSFRYSKYFNHSDSVNFYNDIFKKYGCTRAVFDSTYKYYTRHPKEFDDIYDDIVTELNKRQQEIYLLQQFGMDTARNLYKKKIKWLLPKDGRTEKIPFELAIKDSGIYNIIIQAKIFDDDMAKNARLTVYFWYKNGTEEGYRSYFPEIKYTKEDRYMVINTSKNCPNKKITHIKGWILNDSNKKGFFYKHADIKSIIIVKN